LADQGAKLVSVILQTGDESRAVNEYQQFEKAKNQNAPISAPTETGVSHSAQGGIIANAQRSALTRQDHDAAT
jgi:hypothetical protein